MSGKAVGPGQEVGERGVMNDMIVGLRSPSDGPGWRMGAHNAPLH